MRERCLEWPWGVAGYLVPRPDDVSSLRNMLTSVGFGYETKSWA